MLSSLVPLISLLLALRVTAQWENTGCVMDAGSDLMNCLGNYASIPPAAPTGLSSNAEAAFYCDIYQQLADCWAVGKYCREWLPLQTAADKFCALANGTTLEAINATSSSPLPPTTSISSGALTIQTILPTPGMPTSMTAQPSPTSNATTNEALQTTLSSIIAEASNVVTSIWNNDVGTAIPVITNEFATTTIPTWTQLLPSTAATATDPLGRSQETVLKSTSAPVALREGTGASGNAGRTSCSFVLMAVLAGLVACL